MRTTNPLEREWARRGALVRLQEIQQEQAEIYSSFPELRHGRTAGVSTSAVVFGQARKRRVMSAAAKRAMSAGMRKYWARRKAAEAKKQASK